MPSRPSILGRARTTQPYASNKHGKGSLITSLIVLPHADYECCRKVEATFYLRPEVQRNKKEIGEAIAYIIDKTALDDANKPLWLSELVNAECDEGNVPEVVNMMRTLYGPQGGIRKDYRSNADMLKDDWIMHLDTLKINEEYWGGGIGGIALQAFHVLLPKLSKGFAFSGIAVLSPATPMDAAEDFEKRGLTQCEQERVLIKFYEKVGYELWVRGAEEEEDSMTVMGRQV